HGRLQPIMKLMRSASSANNPVLNGTPEGKALTFAIRTTFCFSAINPIGRSEADDSRIVALELERHDGNAERAREIERVGASFEDWGPSWCRRAIDFAELLAPTLEKLENHAPAANRRHVRNITTLLGAAWLML